MVGLLSITFWPKAFFFRGTPSEMRKIVLPRIPIPGIPRVRAGTGLLKHGDSNASRHFSNGRAGAGVGPSQTAFTWPQSGHEERCRSSDHDGNAGRNER